jgi:prolipoprotein diacylglyceryltransferase
MYVLGYGLGRLWVEALRIDDATRLAGVRVNIWVSLVAIGASIASLAILRHRERTTPAPRASSAAP